MIGALVFACVWAIGIGAFLLVSMRRGRIAHPLQDHISIDNSPVRFRVQIAFYALLLIVGECFLLSFAFGLWD